LAYPPIAPTVSVTAPLAAVSGPAILAAVLDAAVDAPARPDGAAVPDAAAYGVYPLIILIVYVLVTGGILCSDLRRSSPTTGATRQNVSKRAAFRSG